MKPWEALIVGAIGGTLAIYSGKLISKIKIDDPVDAVAVHGVCGAWVRNPITGNCLGHWSSEL